jgi:predicted membrane protein
MRVGVMLGSVVRELAEVPRRLDVRSLLGNVELDLTRARFAPGVTEIALHALMGNIEIQLPANVGVEDHVSAVLGSFEYRRHPRATSWAEASRIDSVVRFTGKVTLSSAEVVIRRDSGGFSRVEE